MNDLNRSIPGAVGAGTADAAINPGLRGFMLGVYQKLAIGIALAGVLAFAAGTIAPLTYLLFATPLKWVVMLAPPALLIGSNFFMRNPSPRGSGLLYWAVVVSLGLSMGIYFAMASAGLGFATGGSLTQLAIVKAFLVTATIFGGLSLFGYTTKSNLGPVGAFAFMAIWGLFVIAVVFMVLPMIFPNVAFLQAGGAMDWIISGGFALLSAIIVAWQTQSLKESYFVMAGNARSEAVMTNMGALNFFVSFVNIFQFVLRMMSND